MNATDPHAAEAPPFGEDTTTPRSSRPRPRGTTPIVVLAVLAIGYTLWAAQSVLLPVLLAMFFALVGNPLIRGLMRLRLPRMLAALVVLLGGLAGTAALGMQLAGPAMQWFREAPRELREVAPKLRELTKPVQDANRAAENLARAAGGGPIKPPQVVQATPAEDPYKALATMPRVVASVLAVVLLTFFFMVYGAHLQRNALALLPDRQQKRFTVELLQNIEREVSRYVLTISVINFAVGLLFALALRLLGFPDGEALLWGTAAALLNFAPYLGPLIGMLAMLVVGFAEFDTPGESLLPAAIYLGLHTLEGQLITPIILGRRMRLSPLVLVLALLVFGGMWGLVGLLLAVPLLVCVKLVLAQVQGLEGWARLLE